MSADLLALLDSDPAAGILAVADLRERRVKVASPGEWRSSPGMSTIYSPVPGGHQRTAIALYPVDAEHIAAEANPAHALAAVRRWRGVVERHKLIDQDTLFCSWCSDESAHPDTAWPCVEIRETADEARAYLGGAA
jgi:hypothetical protein